MKSRILGVFIMLFSLAAFAGGISQAELNNVNEFIGQLLGDAAGMVQIEVTSASRSKKTKLLNAVEVEANIMGFARVELGLKTKKKDITLKGSLSGKAGAIGMGPDDILEMLAEGQKFVDAINKKGDYKAKFSIEGAAEGTDISFSMKPTKENEDPSVKKLEIKGFLPSDANIEATISLKGTLKGGAENVKTVQVALTNIFTNLVAQENPDEADFENLAKVIAEIFKAMSDLEELN